MVLHVKYLRGCTFNMFFAKEKVLFCFVLCIVFFCVCVFSITGLTFFENACVFVNDKLTINYLIYCIIYVFACL